MGDLPILSIFPLVQRSSPEMVCNGVDFPIRLLDDTDDLSTIYSKLTFQNSESPCPQVTFGSKHIFYHPDRL
jgi:hypothetical protein